MRRLLITTCLTWTLMFPSLRLTAAVDFWVWHRTNPLAEEERSALAAMGLKTLYWHVREMENKTGHWCWKAPPRPIQGLAGECQVVPVVRLSHEGKQPFPAASRVELCEELVRVAGPKGALQLDYDCPYRLLSEYAEMLREIRQSIPHLSITALAGWPRVTGFAALTGAVEEIVPMFYDLQADPTGVSAEAPPPPLLDPARIEALMKPWRNCPIPWRAGLPTFSRLTVFDRTGLSRGQIPNWDWDDLCFHKSLHSLAPTRLGVTLLRSDTDTRVASTPVMKDEIVASRFIDRAALAQAIEIARASGPAGVILFRLPDGTGPGGWSLGDLTGISMSVTRPSFMLRRTAGGPLELINESVLDLPPRLSGERDDRDRGYALEIDAPAPIFREALAGDFWRVTSHVQPDSKKPVPVVVPLATRLTFWFSNLRGRATLRTGLLQLAPAANLDTLRYRVLDGGEPGAWKPIAPAVPSPTTAP